MTKRGRPRKHEVHKEPKAKRGRGRPRKTESASAAPVGKAVGASGLGMERAVSRGIGLLKTGKVSGLKDVLSLITQDEMSSLSSLYLDFIGNGFKVSLWSGKNGLVEGFVSEADMPPFVRKVLVRRTESLGPGESIEVIGKREGDIALIASEPIDAQANGALLAEIADKDGEIHLKITMAWEAEKPLTLEEAPSPEELDANIEKLSELMNREISGKSKVAEYGKEALKLLKGIEEHRKLAENPKDKKAISAVYNASLALATLSEGYGFVKVAHLSESLSVLFKAYREKGSADPAAAPIIRETVKMIERIIVGVSGGQDVDALVKKISRKDG